MATARFARPRARTVLNIVLAAAAAAVVIPTTIGSATPRPTLAQVTHQVALLNARAEKVIESYDAARDQLAALKRQQAVAERRLLAAQAEYAKAKTRINNAAAAAYRSGGGGGVDALAAMVGSGDPQTLIDQATTLDQVAQFQQNQLTAVTTSRQAVEKARAALDAQAATQNAKLKALAADKHRIDTLLAAQNKLLASLRAADRARYAAAQSGSSEAMTALRGSYNGPATGRAAAAVQFAYAQLGKPYSYGASGPGSYDCSGLTMAAWGAAGVGLPHNAASQQGQIRSVSYGNLQPGDLVFFGSPAHHVGIYIGNGNMIHAPHTGDVVKISPVAYEGDFSGAGRP